MNFKINSIAISNLRNIPSDNPLTIDLTDPMITILDGPNGYGKTTFFDAIELLLTGSLGHFFSELYSRGAESLSSVANNIEEDTIIIAKIMIKDKGIFTLKRTFSWAQYDVDKISLIEVRAPDGSDANIGNQGKLFEFLGISDSIFNIGMYISQNDSLQFLKLPYNKRKDTFSAITGTESDENKGQYLDAVKRTLMEKKKILEANFDAQIKSVNDKINEYAKLVTIEDESAQVAIYRKIFPYGEYEFDGEMVDIEKIEHYLQRLSQIELFIRDRDSFVNFKNNKEYHDLLHFNKKFYAAIFYKDKLLELKSRQNEMRQLKEFTGIKQQFNAVDKVVYENELFDIVFKESLNKIKELSEAIQLKENNLSGVNLKKNKLIDARTNLKKVHDVDHYLEADICPYCGKEDKELLALFDEVSNILSENESELSKTINELRDQKKKENIYSRIFYW